MTSCDEKKVSSSADAAPGGVFPDEIAAIKERARTGKQCRRKVLIAVTCFLLTVAAIFLGLALTRGSGVRCGGALRFPTENQLLNETVETDPDAETDAFRTEGPGGAAAVLYDHRKLMKAFKFSRSETCFILEETVKEKDEVKETAQELEAKKNGSVQFAQYGGTLVISVDTDRTDRPALSEKLDNFCGQLEPRWAKLTPATEGDGEQIRDTMSIIIPAASVADAAGQVDYGPGRRWVYRFRIVVSDQPPPPPMGPRPGHVGPARA